MLGRVKCLCVVAGEAEVVANSVCVIVVVVVVVVEVALLSIYSLGIEVKTVGVNNMESNIYNGIQYNKKHQNH